MAVFGPASTLPPGFAAGSGRPGVAPVRARSRFYVDAVTLDEQPGMSPWVETEVVEEDLQRACERVESARGEADLVVIIFTGAFPMDGVRRFRERWPTTSDRWAMPLSTPAQTSCWVTTHTSYTAWSAIRTA